MNVIEIKNKWSEYIHNKRNTSKLFEIAFTHPSCKGFSSQLITNETIELIGDKVLDLVLYHYLHTKYRFTISKKQMDDFRKKLMSKSGLEKLFDAFNLKNYLIKPPNHKLTLSPKVKHNIVESLFGAIYIEDGISKVSEFMTDLLNREKNDH